MLYFTRCNFKNMCKRIRVGEDFKILLLALFNAMSDWVRQIKKKWTLTASATPPKARRVSCRVKAMFMVLSLIVAGVGPASWFKALSRRCHSTWIFRANLRAFFPVLALHSGLNAPTEDDMLVFPLQYFIYSSRAVTVNCIQQGFPGGALCRYVHTPSLSLSMDLAGYQRNTVPSLQFPFGGDPGT